MKKISCRACILKLQKKEGKKRNWTKFKVGKKKEKEMEQISVDDSHLSPH